MLELEKQFLEQDPDPYEAVEREREMELRNSSVIYYLFEKYWLSSFRQYLFRTSDLLEAHEILQKWELIIPAELM